MKINSKPINWGLALLLVSVMFSSQIVKAQALTAAEEEKEIDKNGPEKIQEFYTRLCFPENPVTADRYVRIQNEMAAHPSENQLASGKVLSVNSWIYIGPYGAPLGAGTRFSGRLTDLELTSTDNNKIRAMAASGGLWEFNVSGTNYTAISLSSGLSSECGGAFVTDPADSNTIFVGTGEPGIHGGTGLWKTTDLGQTWTSCTMTPPVSAFYQILYDPQNPSTMHAACSEGYYRSDDAGATWIRKLGGNCSDVVVNDSNSQILYAAVWGVGVYKSINGGSNWTLLTTLPTSNVGRTVLAISKQNPDRFFVCMTNNNDNNTKGIYKTNDGGLSFLTCVLNIPGSNPNDFHWGQAWYANDMSISPVNDSIVIAGGGNLMRTFDGFNFSEVDAKHPDQHCMAWNPNGIDFFAGNDGGLFHSLNRGSSFSNLAASDFNTLPVGQFYHFSVGKTHAGVVAGTLQDDGFQFKSTTTGLNWSTSGSGDGSACMVDPNDENTILHGNGIFGGNLKSHRFITFNGGSTFSEIDNGIDPCGDWFPEIRIDGATGMYYTQCEKYVYSSFDQGVTWDKMNPGAPFIKNIEEFTVSADLAGIPNVYLCLGGFSGIHLMVFDRLTSSFVNRSAGLQANTYVAKVAVDINDPDIAYAVEGGTPGNGAGNKVFKTTDRGQTWTNISGNLPNISCTDLIANPYNSNYLYLGTEQGLWKTTDGGLSWNRWNFGMPESGLVTELDYADSTSINGTFYVLCSTYGRGIWMRDVSGDDPNGIAQLTNSNDLALYQNSDNPGDGNTIINYSITKNMPVKLSVYDMIGNEISNLVNANQQSGSHTVLFDRSKLSAGVYMYKLMSGNQSISRRMIVVR